MSKPKKLCLCGHLKVVHANHPLKGCIGKCLRKECKGKCMSYRLVNNGASS